MAISLSIMVAWTLAILGALWDLTQRRIPNALIVVGLALGFSLRAQAEGLSGLLAGLVGAAVALGIYLLPFAMRKVGGGDVKMAMMLGVFLGWRDTLWLILYATALNGVTAMVLLLARRVLAARGKGVPAKLEQVPKAVAFTAALLWVTLSGSRS